EDPAIHPSQELQQRVSFVFSEIEVTVDSDSATWDFSSNTGSCATNACACTGAGALPPYVQSVDGSELEDGALWATDFGFGVMRTDLVPGLDSISVTAPWDVQTACHAHRLANLASYQPAEAHVASSVDPRLYAVSIDA